MQKSLTLLLLFFISSFAQANVILPAIFNHHMVLQQKSEIIIWGWAKPGEEVSVTGNWDNKTVKITAPNHGAWQVKLQTPAADGKAYTLTVQGYNKIVIEDILLGEVWLCSGQSNMEWTAHSKIDNAEEEVKNANYPNIRFFSVGHQTAPNPQLNLHGQWQVCMPETMKYFSAVAYFFGREVQKNLNVPIGLINSSWGGTPAEAWCSKDAIAENAEIAQAAAKLTEVPWGPVKPGLIYNAMINPLIPFRIAGALWYQGEGNVSQAWTYDKLLAGLIQNWRSAWGYEFPFYYVQIAPYEYGSVPQGVLLRDAQRLAMKTPNTGMVVISDVGNIKDIHPRNKLDVGKRLANWALNKTYGKSEIPFSGPLYKDMKVEKDKIRVFFNYAEGLMMKGKELILFEIAGDDQKFYPAKAKIDKNTVIVQAKEVKNPVAVRFAWNNIAEPNLFNGAGLPASCFRTDTWEIKW